MLDKDDNAVLVDFGVSNLFEDHDKVKGTAGSILYFSPEVVRTGVGTKIIHGRKTDIWALGVTLFQMATLKPPFNAKTLPGIQKQLLEEEPDYSMIKDQTLVDFFKQVFIKDQDQRPEVDQLLVHDWVTNGGEDHVTIYHNDQEFQDLMDQRDFLMGPDEINIDSDPTFSSAAR